MALHPRVLHRVTTNGKLPRASVSTIGPKGLDPEPLSRAAINGASLTIRTLATSVPPSDNQRVRLLIRRRALADILRVVGWVSFVGQTSGAASDNTWAA